MTLNQCFVIGLSVFSLLFTLGGGFFAIVKMLIRIEHRLTELEASFITIGKEKNVILLRDSRIHKIKKKKSVK